VDEQSSGIAHSNRVLFKLVELGGVARQDKRFNSFIATVLLHLDVFV